MAVKGVGENPVLQNEQPRNQVSGKALSQEDFMKLFLAQMRTQSPLKPFDSGEMMQQMSQLTSLSATQELEKTIKMMNANLGRSQVVSATQLIGKRVAIASEKSPLVYNADGTPQGLDGSIVLPKASTGCKIEIKDSANKVVATLNLPASGSGVQDFHWDGKGADGKPLPADFYTITANAKIDGQDQRVYTAGVFKINSVTMDRQTSAVILNVDGMGGMDMGDIIKIMS
jgi:flagellar basal-body rod modification protein FlgD